MSAELDQIVEASLRSRAKVAGRMFTVDQQRAQFQRATAMLPNLDGASIEAVDAGGVPSEWIEVESAASRTAIAYLHGGGFALGGLDTHRTFASHVAKELEARVLTVDYRLAPEHPFPAGLNDAVAAYEWMLEKIRSDDRVIVMGDSAGGGLAMSLCLRIRDEGRRMPDAMVLLSPWADLDWPDDRDGPDEADDPLVTEASFRQFRQWYLPAGADPSLWTAPLRRELSGLPPTLIQSAGRELLRTSSGPLSDALRTQGVTVTHDMWPEMVHAWQLYAGIVPEADDALRAAAQWLRSTLPL